MIDPGTSSKTRKPRLKFFCVDCHAVFATVPLSPDGQATECPECECPWIHSLGGNVMVDTDGEPIRVKTPGGDFTFFAT